MKNLHKPYLSFLMFVLFLSSAAAQERVEKNRNEEFKADKGTSIEVDSKFGHVEILDWDNNSVKVEANIWVEAPRESEANDILDKLDVEISESAGVISVKTILPEKTNYGKNVKFQVDFTIHAPASMDLNIGSKYGSVFISNNTGHVVLNVKYGTLKAGSLSREKEKPLNEINLAYSSASFEEVGWLKMDNAYSKVNIDEATAIVLISKYSSLTAGECSSLVVDSKYDNYRIEELVNFNGELKYSNVKIDELEKKLEFNGSYSSLGIKEMGPEFDLIRVNTTYGGVKIGIDPGSSFKFTGKATHADISVSGLDVVSKKVEGSTKYLEGTKGSNPEATVEIETKYAGVKIYED